MVIFNSYVNVYQRVRLIKKIKTFHGVQKANGELLLMGSTCWLRLGVVNKLHMAGWLKAADA
jgi:hypothetical protein